MSQVSTTALERKVLYDIMYIINIYNLKIKLGQGKVG